MMNESLFKSGRQDWQTPSEVFDPLNAEFGFTIDAAASQENALLPRYWTEEDDSPNQPWGSERVWCNPPYGREQKRFIEKAAKMEADVAVLLIPARPDTAAWHNWIFPYAEVRFVRGRIKFVGGEFAAPFPTAIVIWWKEGVDKSVLCKTWECR